MICAPLGWRPMWELPAPGRQRRFVFVTHDGSFRVHDKISLIAVRCKDGAIIEDQLSAIGWRYV